MYLLISGLLLAGCAPKDEATWRYDTAAPAEDGGPGEGVDEDDEDDDEWDEYEKWMWGEFERDEGWTGFFYVDPDAGGVLCDMDYEAEWAPTDECADCVEAWTITRGEVEIWDDVDGACAAEGWTDLTGTSFGVGHDEEDLWADLGEGWQRVEEAEGEIEDDWMFFGIWLGG